MAARKNGGKKATKAPSTPTSPDQITDASPAMETEVPSLTTDLTAAAPVDSGLAQLFEEGSATPEKPVAAGSPTKELTTEVPTDAPSMKTQPASPKGFMAYGKASLAPTGTSVSALSAMPPTFSAAVAAGVPKPLGTGGRSLLQVCAFTLNPDLWVPSLAVSLPNFSRQIWSFPIATLPRQNSVCLHPRQADFVAYPDHRFLNLVASPQTWSLISKRSQCIKAPFS